jgi:hypothetical protein
MQFLIVFISYLVSTQHVSSDICLSSGVLFTVHSASGYLCCYLSVALSCVNSLHKFVSLLDCTEMHGTKNFKLRQIFFWVLRYFSVSITLQRHMFIFHSFTTDII